MKVRGVNLLRIPIPFTIFGDVEGRIGYVEQKGWTITYIVLMVVFLLLNLLTFWFCKECVLENTDEMETDETEEPSIMEGLKSLIKNKYWILIVIMLFVIYFMMSVFFGSNFYFAQYVVGNAGAYASLANAISLSQIGIMFVTPIIMKKIGTRMTALIGMVLSVAGFILTIIAGSNVSFLIVCNVIKGVGFGMGAATMFGMLQDAITYGQWLTNVRAMGMGNADN